MKSERVERCVQLYEELFVKEPLPKAVYSEKLAELSELVKTLTFDEYDLYEERTTGFENDAALD